jgi:hypothetical protein
MKSKKNTYDLFILFLLFLIFIFVIAIIIKYFKNKKCNRENFIENTIMNKTTDLMLDLDFNKIEKFNTTDYPIQEYLMYNKNRINFVVYDKLRKMNITYSKYYNKIQNIVKMSSKNDNTCLKLYNNNLYLSYLSFDLGNTFINTISVSFRINNNNPIHILLKCKDPMSKKIFYVALIKKKKTHKYSLIMDRIELKIDSTEKTDFELIRDSEIFRLTNEVHNNEYRSEYLNIVEKDEFIKIDIIKDYIDTKHFIYHIYRDGYEIEQGNKTENLLSYGECTIGEYFDGYIRFIKLYNNAQEPIMNSHAVDCIIDYKNKNIDEEIDEEGRLTKKANLLYFTNFGKEDMKILSAPAGTDYKKFNTIRSHLDSAHIITGFDEMPFDNRNCNNDDLNEKICKQRDTYNVNSEDNKSIIDMKNNNTLCLDKII